MNKKNFKGFPKGAELEGEEMLETMFYNLMDLMNRYYSDTPLRSIAFIKDKLGEYYERRSEEGK